MIICNAVPKIWRMTDVFVIFHFGLLFPLLPPPSSPKNENFKKMKKNAWWYHHFTFVNHKLWLDDVWFLRYGARRMDGRTDGWTDGKSDIYRWVPHLKNRMNIFFIHNKQTVCHFWGWGKLKEKSLKGPKSKNYHENSNDFSDVC